MRNTQLIRNTQEIKDKYENILYLDSIYEDDSEFYAGQLDILEWLLGLGIYAPPKQKMFNAGKINFVYKGRPKYIEALLLQEEPDINVTNVDEFKESSTELLESTKVKTTGDNYKFGVEENITFILKDKSIAERRNRPLGRYAVLYDPDTKIPYLYHDYGSMIWSAGFGSITMDIEAIYDFN